MKIGLIPQNPIEWLTVKRNKTPRPLFETKFAYTQARVIMVATKLGVFEALAKGPARGDDVAAQCGTDAVATEKLLFTLASAGYLTSEGGRYALSPVSRTWMLRDSPKSFTDMMLFQFPQWAWLDHVEDYLRSGRPIDMHTKISADEWDVYQRAMRALAGSIADEAIRRVPVSKSPRAMLDIGGSHGYYSVAFCRRHAGLRSTVLDLPQAVEHAAPLLAAEGMGERVVHRAGNALTEELGSEQYDIVLVSQLVHHFTEAENVDLAVRVSRALKPRGVFVVLDQFRSSTPEKTSQATALQEFFFAFTSQSGTWLAADVADWQRRAGLRPRRHRQLRTSAGVGVQVAVKPH